MGVMSRYDVYYFLVGKTHVSRTIAALCGGVLIGVKLSYFYHSLYIGIVWLVGAAVLSAISVLKGMRWMLLLCVLAGVIVGMWRGGSEYRQLAEWENFVGTQAVFEGKIVEDTSRAHGGEAKMVLGEIRYHGRSLKGEIWATTISSAILKRGDSVRVRAHILEGFGSFAASSYAVQVLRHVSVTDQSRDMRDWFAEKIRSAVDEPFASLGIGFLVGQKSSLPTDIEEQLRVVGLTHIIVASGYNLTVLLRMTRKIFEGISKYLTALSGGVLIGGFTLMTGLSPSMTRAGMVAGLSLAVWYYGRHISPFILLLLVAAISVLWKPAYIWSDVGWYLSFAAFIGVMILAPLLHDYFYGEQKAGFLRQVVIETVSALLLTLPISLAIFHSYAVYALPANVMIVPLVPYAMLLTFFAGIGAWIAPHYAALLGTPAQLLLEWMSRCVAWWASQPGAKSEALLDSRVYIVYYVALVCSAIYLWYRTKHSFRGDNIVE